AAPRVPGLGRQSAEAGGRRVMGRISRWRRALVALALAALAGVPAYAQEAPDALVRRVSQEVLQIVKTDPKVQAGDQARIREVVETKLLQHFDFTRMTALAMGRNWA